MLRNSGGLSLLRGRLGVQVVVDKHTIDDSLWLHGWDATKRPQHGQGPIEAVWGASPIPAAQPVALFARLAQEFSWADYGISISVGVL